MRPLTLSLLLLFCARYTAQEWKLKLSSNVELRSWRLTSKAEKKEKSLQGASITLMKGSGIIGQTTSDPNGDFVIDVPANGDFVLTVSYPGCNTKKFYVSTNGVPENVGKDNFKPTVTIGGFVMSKPITGVDYIGLNEPLVKVEYKTGGQNFDKDDAVTNKGIQTVSNINTAENTLIDNFCALNKAGDDALNKKKCELAKQNYTKARAMMPDEQYPVEQLVKVEECLNEKKVKEEIAAEEAAKKAEDLKLTNEKAAKEKAEKEKASFQKNVKKTESTAPTKTVASASTTGNTSNSNPANNNVITPKETSGSTKTADNTGGGKSKYQMQRVLGKDVYKETISKADDYYKTKRYKEAKEAYQDALRLKENDAYANTKISDCDLRIKECEEKANKK
jgi:tetratricopeptide (TPR) repeat protein